MKKVWMAGAAVACAFALACGGLGGAGSAKVSAGEADVIADIATTQYFSDEAVPDEIMEKIVMAGVNAPSAMNSQPWHFTFVTDRSVLQQIADEMSANMPAGAGAGSGSSTLTKAGMADAPLAIIISCKEGSEFDAGLACQNMSAEANLLGYGTKIISSPGMVLNGERQEEYRTLLGIPEDQEAVAVLLVGKEDTEIDPDTDGYTGATTRNPLAGTVSYLP